MAYDKVYDQSGKNSDIPGTKKIMCRDPWSFTGPHKKAHE